MLKNIVFDLGNVLLDFNPEKYLTDLNFNNKQRKKLINAIFQTEEWLKLDRGTITETEAVEIWQERNPELKTEITAVMENWSEMLTVKKKSLEILKELAEKDYNLYVLSNFHHKAYNYVSSKYSFFEYFTGQIISADIKMIKPEAEIFKFLLNKFNLKAGETLFIDDSKKNIEAALKQGIRVIHFTDAESLKKELKLYLRE